jgi:hypothetical protein
MDTCVWRQLWTQILALEWARSYKAERFVTSCRQRCVYMALLLHTTGSGLGKREVLKEAIDRFSDATALGAHDSSFCNDDQGAW